jgi:hypothetical protein
MCENEDKYVKVKIISGESVTVKEKNIVGFCLCDRHRGYITRTNLKNHDCIAKKCPFLRKKKDNPYWENVKIFKDKRKQQKQAFSDMKKNNARQEKLWAGECQRIADLSGYPITIISVKKLTAKNKVMIFYVSGKNKDDSHRFRLLAKEFSDRYQINAEIRHIKNLDGDYVTY